MIRIQYLAIPSPNNRILTQKKKKKYTEYQRTLENNKYRNSESQFVVKFLFVRKENVIHQRKY